MGNKRIPPESGNYYHIFSHSTGKEHLFLNVDNYLFFLKKYDFHNNFLTNKPAKIKKKEIFERFNTKENFTAYHSRKIDNNLITELEN